MHTDDERANSGNDDLTAKAWRENASRHALAMAAVNDGIWDWDVPSGAAYFSPLYYTMLGYEEGEFAAAYDAWRRLVHPEDLERVERDLRRSVETGEGFSIDLRMRTKSGAWLWTVTRGKVVHWGPDGNAVRMIGTLGDITERKAIEEKWIESTRRFELATASGQLGVWDWNVAENIMVWDDRMFELYGLTRDAFPGCVDAWMNGLHPDDRERAIAECQAALRGEKAFDPEFRVVHPDGTIRHLKANAVVLRDADGRAVRMTGLNRDITEKRRMATEREHLQAQLNQAQKMESVGRLAGGVAHNFNNMLAVILGYANLVLEQVGPASPIRDDLEAIRSAAERSATLTRQLLTYACKQIVMPRELDLNGTVTELLDLLRPLIGEAIELVFRPGANLAPIRIDPSQLDQILLDLCINAREAIDGVGRITLETGLVALAAGRFADQPRFEPGDYVMLSVTDTGCGMDEATQSRIFEPFFTTRAFGAGRGLGLATVYGTVRQNGGVIEVTSAPGRGTAFRIYLPPVKPSPPGSR